MSRLIDERGADDEPRDELVDLLRLALVAGVGPRTRKALLDHFGSAAAVLGATAEQLQSVPRLGPKLARQICGARDEIDAAAEIERCQRHGIEIRTEGCSSYPRPLREIHDPPGVLFVKGTLLPADCLAIGIVGTRHATSYGKQQAERLAAGLSRAGLTIVSGLARGIDAAAHRGALEAGGRTLAVLGGGILRIYPEEHKELAHEVSQAGALISESPPCFQPRGGSFPQRNRLISGLSLGIVVVEAAERSGALITARHAAEQGREVFAVPGAVTSRVSRGCHRLIRDGAKLVETADDVLEELGPLIEPTTRADGSVVHHPAELQLNELEQQVLQAVESQSTPIDTIIRSTGLPVQRVLATLSILEMRRLIRRLSGNQVARV